MTQVSVIIPVYNGERTNRETIESVLGQSFSDFELIVIDDGSVDRMSRSYHRLKILGFESYHIPIEV